MIYFVMVDSEGRNKSRAMPVQRDGCGYPLTLATVADNVDVREALAEMEPGDRLEMRSDD